MTDFYQKVTDMQGTVEDLVRKVPGFKGYFEMQDRRAADRLLREHLVTVFEQELNEFVRLQKELLDIPGGIGFMERVQGIQTKMQTFIDRIESAAEGYAGVFDAAKVDQAALDRVYAFDNTLLVYQQQFSTGLEELNTAITGEQEGAEIKNVLRQLDDIVTEANNTFKFRTEAMRGLQESV
jgi:hypothetical protein